MKTARFSRLDFLADELAQGLRAQAGLARILGGPGRDPGVGGLARRPALRLND